MPLKKAKKSSKSAKSTAVKSTTAKAHSAPKKALEAYSRDQLEKALKIDAKALGIPSGAAEIFIKHTLDAVEKSLGPKEIITERDLTSAIAKELKKYNADFAYIYRNRDKIV